MPKLSPSGLSPSPGHHSSTVLEQPPRPTLHGPGAGNGAARPPQSPIVPGQPWEQGGSMGCKQPGEPLWRGVNKGISETVSELVPAGRRNGTIPIPAHNREQPSPHSLAGKAGDKGERATSGDSASLPRGQRGGLCEPQCRRWQWDRAGTGSKSHPGSSCTFSQDSASLAAKVSAFPAVPGREPS